MWSLQRIVKSSIFLLGKCIYISIIQSLAVCDGEIVFLCIWEAPIWQVGLPFSGQTTTEGEHGQ